MTTQEPRTENQEPSPGKLHINGHVSSAHSPDELLKRPFDQYGRYTMIREALDAARALLGGPLRVLDVGGIATTRRGETVLPAVDFLRDDDVTVLDQPECDLPGYVRGDGRGLHFADAAFDFVVSCDTLEHVPASDRPAFWRELLRVARYGVILAAPSASPEVVAAEALLRGFIVAELGVEQPQLKEHVEFGLPKVATTTALLDELGLRHYVYPSGYVHAWLVMMFAKHLHLFGDLDLHEQLDAYYTRFFGPDERREPAYRHIVIVEKDGKAGWLDAVEAALRPTIRAAAPAAPGWPDLATWTIQTVATRASERQKDVIDAQQRAITTQQQTIAAQQQTIAAQQQTIAAQQRDLVQREAHVRDLEARARWLDEQAQAAHRSLAAVERGRVLRLLRWAHKQRGAK